MVISQCILVKGGGGGGGEEVFIQVCPRKCSFKYSFYQLSDANTLSNVKIMRVKNPFN